MTDFRGRSDYDRKAVSSRVAGDEKPRRKDVDAEDVSRAVVGDHRAFGRLFKRHAPWVYGRLRRMLGPRTDLEDLVQEVFLRAHRSLPSFRGQASFGSWLRRICARVAYDQIRQGSRGVQLCLVEEEPKGEVNVDVEEREAVRELMRIIGKLSAEKQTVLVLHDVEGYTAEEIRLVVGVRSVNTVHSRLRLARAEVHRKAMANPALRWLYEPRGR